MIGFTLFSYLFRRYAVTFVQYFLGICVISYLVDFTEFSRFKSTLPGYTIGAGLLVSALRIPLIAQTAIPFIILFSAIATLMSLNRRYELVVARSAGVSAWQFLAPLCLASLIIGILAVTVFNPLGARALSWAQQLEASFSAESQSNFDARIPWLRQRDADGVTIIGAKSTARHGLQLNQATFLQIDLAGEIVDRIDARQATLGDRLWLIDDAVRRRRGEAPERFDHLEVKTSLMPEFVEEKLARPETIPFFELPRKMQAAWSFGLNANQFRHAVPFAHRAADADGRHDADRRHGFDAFCPNGAVRDHDFGWRRSGLSALCGIGFGEGIRNRGNRAACCRCMDSCRGIDVFRGDVPVVQGRRLVAVVPVEGRKRLIMARLAGATALACLLAVGGASAAFAQDAEHAGARGSRQFADAARGRHAGLRQ